ncbi:hypothetical protein [Micromonospora sp. NPDC048169]|uniref:hypothetical protein n=1 Tax=Micromonospora sp. NPDC048169 TaxID=3154711 RepID=UPI0033DF7594
MSYLDDVDTVLTAWLGWYGRHVEPVGQLAHPSVSKLEINRDRHPRWKRTIPAEQIAEIRRGVQLFEGSIAWGGDKVRADEAHFWIARLQEDPLLVFFAERVRSGYLNDE